MKETVFTSPSDDPLKEAQAQYSVFVKDIGKIAQGDRRPYVADKDGDTVKRIVKSISNLLQKAGKDASALEIDGTGDPHDLSAAAINAYMISAQVRRDQLINLSSGLKKQETPQTATEIKSKVEKINNLLDAGEANPREFSPNGKTTNEETLAEIAAYANERSAHLRLQKIIEAAFNEEIEGVTDSVALDAQKANINCIAAKKYNLPNLDLPNADTKKQVIKAFKIVYLLTEQNEVKAERIPLPDSRQDDWIPDEAMPDGVVNKRNIFFEGTLDDPSFLTGDVSEQILKEDFNKQADFSSLGPLEQKKILDETTPLAERLNPYAKEINPLIGKIVSNKELGIAFKETGHTLENLTPKEGEEALLNLRKEFLLENVYFITKEDATNIRKINLQNKDGVEAQEAIFSAMEGNVNELFSEIQFTAIRVAALIDDPKVIEAFLKTAKSLEDHSDMVVSEDLVKLDDVRKAVLEKFTQERSEKRSLKKLMPQP